MAVSANSVLANLAQLSPDSDKASVIAAIDEAVDDLIGQVQSSADATADPEFLEQTKQTIIFLEACTGFPDPEFTEHSRKRMLELQGVLVGSNTPSAEPEQAGPSEAPEEAADSAEPVPEVPPESLVSFEEVFTDSLCKFVTDRLALFHVPQPPDELLDNHDGLLPYPLSLEFSTDLESVIRTHFIRPILGSRNMKILAGGVGQNDLNEAYFMNIFNLPKRENVVRTLWGSQWDIIKAALHSQQTAQNQAAQTQSGGRGKKKESLLGRMFSKKAKAPKGPVQPAAGSDTAIGLQIWSELTQTSGKEYDPPRPEEIGLFDALFDYKPGTINKRKVAVEQLLRQEVGDQEGREGSSRLYMARMVMELPPHCGELIALSAYYEHQEIFSPEVLKAYLASQATSESGRRAALPLFLRWLPDPIGRNEE
tara:strand:+ start:1821 stop:3092 length:1272 start_codon:yes stop_codon:yes gene_type:complete